MGWLYVPGLEGSNSESTSSSHHTALFVTSNGKPTPRPSSWHGWKKRPWHRLLSGTTCAPSTAARGVDAWTSSLRVTRASRSASPESELAKTIRAISGPTSDGLLARYYRRWSTSRTSQLTFDLDSTLFEPSYEEWAIALRREFSARQKWARDTNGRGSSLWPTAAARDGKGATKDPVAPDGRKRLDQLDRAAEHWQTPRVSRGQYTRDGGQPGKERSSLEGQARQWPTPRAEDAESSGWRHGRGVSDTLTAVSRSMPPVRTSETPGHTCSSKCRRLNPLFVEWLMGWPIGWTGFERLETEFTRWLQLSRSYLYGSN